MPSEPVIIARLSRARNLNTYKREFMLFNPTDNECRRAVEAANGLPAVQSAAELAQVDDAEQGQEGEGREREGEKEKEQGRESGGSQHQQKQQTQEGAREARQSPASTASPSPAAPSSPATPPVGASGELAVRTAPAELARSISPRSAGIR